MKKMLKKYIKIQSNRLQICQYSFANIKRLSFNDRCLISLPQNSKGTSLTTLFFKTVTPMCLHTVTLFFSRVRSSSPVLLALSDPVPLHYEGKAAADRVDAARARNRCQPVRGSFSLPISALTLLLPARQVDPRKRKIEIKRE